MSVINASHSSITLGETSGRCGHYTRSPLRPTKRPSKRVVVDPVSTLPSWSVPSSTRTRFIMPFLRISTVSVATPGTQSDALESVSHTICGYVSNSTSICVHVLGMVPNKSIAFKIKTKISLFERSINQYRTGNAHLVAI